MHKANQYEQLQAEERLEIASLRQRGSLGLYAQP